MKMTFTEIHRIMRKAANAEEFFQLEETKRVVDVKTKRDMLHLLHDEGYFPLIVNSHQFSVSKPNVTVDGDINMDYWYYIKDENKSENHEDDESENKPIGIISTTFIC